MEEVRGPRKLVAVLTCIEMALTYVLILYIPTVVFRLPPPSFKNFMIRRFICAIVSSILSLLITTQFLPVRTWAVPYLLSVYGIRLDHFWQAVVFPLSLTSLMYAGSLFLKSLLLVDSWKEHRSSGGGLSFDSCKNVSRRFLGWLSAITFNVLAWRNYVVAPLTEELVFRACMITVLLCGGFKTYNAILLCPIFFSLAHLNHFMEIYINQNYNLIKASMLTGLQLGYTIIFGSYASFLYIRTGHLIAPIVAHIYCNFMGLPTLSSRRSVASRPQKSEPIYNDAAQELAQLIEHLYRAISGFNLSEINFSLDVVEPSLPPIPRDGKEMKWCIFSCAHGPLILFLEPESGIHGFTIFLLLKLRLWTCYSFLAQAHLFPICVSGMVTLAFIMGFLGFLWLLFPMTSPDLYNDRIDNCSCWHGYCSWRQEIVKS